MDSSSATFTKWLVGQGPEMAGIAGGVVGDGTFHGKVLELLEGDPTTIVRAIYRFSGPEHDFTVLMYVEQTGLRAVLTGVVTDGWRKGSLVRGEYTQIEHEHDGIMTDAWQGSVDLIDVPAESPAGALT
jgi:hypothetical protein